MKFTTAVVALIGTTQAYITYQNPDLKVMPNFYAKLVPTLMNLDLVADSAAAKRAHDLTNQFRKSQGLSTLGFDSALTKLAAEHNQYQAKQGKISHDNFSTRVSKIPYAHGGSAENVAYNFAADSGAKVVDQWKNSDGHRKNMLGASYNVEGLAALKDTSNGRVYFTQIFTQKK